ncbi:MAG TPA: DivIVA domain-containing protein [Mobilitalea sp.]|nr:DivIVA domain-containing protein [Mobilitalea sp.]
MFTPSQIHDKVFKNGLGYDKKDVEQFIKELSSDYEQQIQENEDLKKKVKDLSDSIGYYKSIEKTLQKALFLAEKTAQDTKASAIKEAEVIEQEARTKAQHIQVEARKQIEVLEHKTINLLQQYDFFKIQFQNLLNSQIELLNSGSFSINTTDFLYKETLYTEKKAAGSPSYAEEAAGSPSYVKEDIGSPSYVEEDCEQESVLGLYTESKEQNYHTEDGFEFITINK